ncbi:MAG: phage holin family protein [Comamonas sp.]|uniref:phage holin family protein n=1 Tax=Comamonas TaxID=283 RepID=UPI000EB34C19|nr:phage holin family protein [Comamonas sp. lk]
MNWNSLLGLDALTARWRAVAIETAIAAEDRVDLARLEWREHKRSLQTLLILVVALGGLTVVALVILSLALVVQFWDTPHRATVAWCLGGGWTLIWALALWRLLAVVRQLSKPFALTRNELKTDWQALKVKL